MTLGPAAPALALVGAVWLACAPAGRAEDPLAAVADSPQAAWDMLLGEHVSDGRVDYQSIAAWPKRLDAFLAWVDATDPSMLTSREARLAFLINAYNACAIRQVLDRWPIGSVAEVKGFFSRKSCRVGGTERSLDDLEASAGRLGDWRVHLAVARAAKGCPTLRSEAYDGARVTEQLSDQATRFLTDRVHGLRLEGATLWVSPIFKWHAEDFARPGQARSRKLTSGRLLSVLLPYLEPTLAEAIQALNPSVKYLDCDWTLNAPLPVVL